MATPEAIKQHLLFTVEDLHYIYYEKRQFHWIFYIADGAGKADEAMIEECKAQSEEVRPATILVEFFPAININTNKSPDNKNPNKNLVLTQASKYGYTTQQGISKVIKRFIPEVEHLSFDKDVNDFIIHVADKSGQADGILLDKVENLLSQVSHLNDFKVQPFPESEKESLPVMNFNIKNEIHSPAFMGEYRDNLIKQVSFEREEIFHEQLYTYAEFKGTIFKRLPWLKDKISSIIFNQLSDVSLKHLLPLYQRIYLPIFSGDEILNSLEWKDIIALSSKARIVPVLMHPLHMYPSRPIRQLFEQPNAHFLLARDMDEIMLEWSYSNKLPWTLYRDNHMLSQRMHGETRRLILAYHNEPKFDRVSKAVAQELQHQTYFARAAEEELWNHGFYMRMGLVAPGSYLLHSRDKIFIELHGALTTLMMGAALGATVLPDRLVSYEGLSILSNIAYGSFYKPFPSVQPFTNLEFLLNGLQIGAPKEMGLLKYADLLHQEGVNHIHDAINSILTEENKDKEGSIIKIMEGVRHVNQIIDNHTPKKNVGDWIEKADLLGLLVGVGASTIGIDNPYASWAINHATKAILTGIAR